MNNLAPSKSVTLSAPRSADQHSKRLLVGLAGVFLAAIAAGLNSRVGALALADVRGAFGFGFDGASWITTTYNAGELIAMPFSAWFAVTLSIRRFELWMIGLCAALAVAVPFVHDLKLLLLLRFLQGIAGGMLIPVLMMAALKFLPISIRLYGLALYAMTATFAPNLSIWLAGHWVDEIFDWRWVYWQFLPVAVAAALLICWGLPREPMQTARFKDANWPGMVCGVLALGLIAVALDQGVRLDWFRSSLITVSLVMGVALLAVYLTTEWYHPSPFIKLQILSRRNLGLGFALFVFLLVLLISSSLLPANYLAATREYRPLQMAPIGLIVALPQLFLGGVVAQLLYQRWVDARLLFSFGLLLIAVACFYGTQLTSEWNREQFVIAQTLQAFGQPLAVVSMLFLATSVVKPREGPFVSGTINTLRAFGALLGSAAIGQLLTVRSRFHEEMLLDHAALMGNSIPFPLEPSQLVDAIGQQSLVLSIGDVYFLMGILALLLIPLVLRLTPIPAPNLSVGLSPTPQSFKSQR